MHDTNDYEYVSDHSAPPVSVEPEHTTEDNEVELSLRPSSLDAFIGQDHIKTSLQIALDAAAKRTEPIEHVLLYGNPGLGKTTLASIIAHEMQATIRMTAGPALERVGDLAAILSNLKRGDVLFIDEIHRMNKTIEEVLYSAMEDYALDIIVGKGPSARTLRMPLERFTLVGATTKLNMLSNPLRDRFGHIYHFRFYEQSHMEHIIARNASLLDLSIDDAGTTTIAKRARRTPRIANRLLKRVRDYAEVHHQGTITKDIALTAFDLLQIDPLGLNHADRLILRTIADQFDGGPVGLRTLAAATSEDAETIESIIEPYLLQLGLMDRTPRGRTITPKAREHLIAFPF